VDTSTVNRAYDRRRPTTTAVYSGAAMADCVLLPLDTADYTVMGNGSVSVRFPVRYSGVYSVQQYTYIAGKIDRRLVSFRFVYFWIRKSRKQHAG